MRFAFAVALLIAAPSFADSSTDGVGRISLGGGLRWTMNDYFNSRATEVGRPVLKTGTAPYGFQGMASFGYGAFDWLELAVDLFGGFESFQLADEELFSSVSYGGLIGLRVTRYDFPFQGLVPYVGVQTGPMLTIVTAPTEPGGERILQGWSVNGGATFRITERIGVFVDARYLYGRVFVAELAGRNVGGVFVSAGVSLFFPSSPKRDLDVPGFGGSSKF
ncbi:MAG: hypothetical protein ABTQ32_34535 [Myxococcaceae bacterium]